MISAGNVILTYENSIVVMRHKLYWVIIILNVCNSFHKGKNYCVRNRNANSTVEMTCLLQDQKPQSTTHCDFSIEKILAQNWCVAFICYVHVFHLSSLSMDVILIHGCHPWMRFLHLWMTSTDDTFIRG